jgi:hypothetical protein
VTKLENKGGRNRDADCEQPLHDPCDEMDFVHDVGTPIVQLNRRSQIAPRANAQQTQYLIIR